MRAVIRFAGRAWPVGLVVGVLALGGWLAVTWVPDWPTDTSNVVERLGWLVGILVGVVGAALWAVRRWRTAHAPKDGDLLGRVLHLRAGRLPTVLQVSLVALRVKPAIGSNSDDDADLPPYVARDADAALRDVLREGGMVLLHGRAAAGKSRTALQALRDVHPRTPLVVPRDGTALRELVEAGLVPRPAVVWLDDLERYLAGGGLDLGVLQRLCPAGGSNVVVVATMRDEYLSDRDCSNIDQSGAEVLEQVRGRRRVRIDRDLSEPELKSACALVGKDKRIGQAVVAPEGFAEHLAAGVALLDRWLTGDGPLFHVGQTLISAAVDCRRAGMHAPVPAATLVDLCREYLPTGWRDRADLPPEPTALVWACERVLGASSCLLPRDGDRYLASDYLVDRVVEGDTPLGREPVRERTWQALLKVATIPQAVDIGLVAYRTNKLDIAEQATLPGAEAGDVRAMFNIAVFLGMRGDDAGAERWYRAGAAAEDQQAMNNLAGLLAKRGEDTEAEQWWRAAAAAGHPMALTNLGLLFEQNDRQADAEQCYREAADAGSSRALYYLGVLHEARQEYADAERLHLAAAKAGYTGSMLAMGNLHEKRGDDLEARRWYRRAAEAGEPAGISNLAVLLHRRGDLVEAERWYRKAAEADRPIALFNLGVFLEERGDEAEEWYRRAAETGHHGAMTNLGNLHYRRDQRKEGAKWWRQAAKAGNGTAMHNLAQHVLARGRKTEGLRWLRKSAETGYVEAMSDLSDRLNRHDQPAAEHWWRKAADAGHAGAMTQLGVVLESRGEYAEAERHWRDAARAGHVRAKYCLGLLLSERAEHREAERWYREAADAGDSNAQHNLGLQLIRTKRYVEAEHQLRAAEENGATSTTQHALAVALWGQRKRDEAEQWFRKAAEDGHPPSMHGLAVALARRGEHDEAERWRLDAAKAGSELAADELRAGRESEHVDRMPTAIRRTYD